MNKISVRDNDELIEDLANLEHEQWWEWSEGVKKEVSEERLERWKKYWVDYKELTEEVKDQDRIWAKKVIKILKKHNLI